MEQNKEQHGVQTLTLTKNPDNYDVIFLNDNFTTMDFVIEILKKVFFHNGTVATTIMVTIHKKAPVLLELTSLILLNQNNRKLLRWHRKLDFH